MVRRLIIAFALAGATGSEPSIIYTQANECEITTALRVRGHYRRACVEFLESMARVARVEMMVNERPQRKRKR